MKIQREYVIALLVLGSIGLLIFGVNFLKGLDLFEKRNVYHVVYDDVTGITESSPVYYNGFKVGQVIHTRFIPASGHIAVTFQLNEDRLRLPKDSRVEIFSVDLFTRALQLMKGDSANFVSSGDTLVGSAQLSLTETVSEQIDPLKRKAEGMLASVDSVLTSLQKVLNDSARGDIDASFASIRSTLETFNHTARQIDDLLNRESVTIRLAIENLGTVVQTMADQNDRIVRIFSNMDSVSTTLANGDLDRILAEMSVTSAKLRTVMDGLEQGEGTLGNLLKNDTLYMNLENATRELDLLLEDMRLNPNRYVHVSVFGKKDRMPKLSDSDIDRLKRSLEDDKRAP